MPTPSTPTTVPTPAPAPFQPTVTPTAPPPKTSVHTFESIKPILDTAFGQPEVKGVVQTYTLPRRVGFLLIRHEGWSLRVYSRSGQDLTVTEGVDFDLLVGQLRVLRLLPV